MRTHILVLASLLLTTIGTARTASAAPACTNRRPALSLVVLVQADEGWMGNELYNADRPMPGAFAGLPAALRAFTGGAPARARAALMTFADQVTVARRFAGVRGLDKAIGRQKDYEGRMSVGLIAGLQEAHALLVPEGCRRKVLVVMGDGTNINSSFQTELDAEIKKLQATGVEVFTIFLATEMTLAMGAPEHQRNLERLGFSGFYRANSHGSLKSHAADIMSRLRTTGRR